MLVKTRSGPPVALFLSFFLLLGSSEAARAQVRPPVVLGVAIDEVGIAPGDLQRSQELVLALLGALPQGSTMTILRFSGDKRIVLPPTSDRKLLASALAGFKADASGVALPDGLFDMVEYLASRDSDFRALLLVSAGRVREGDLKFEDPLTAAASKQIPIYALALGQGDGKLLRRIAKLTGGEYSRLEVADAKMLAQMMLPRVAALPTAPAVPAPLVPSSTPEPKPEPRSSGGLLGAAALLFSVGGVLMLGIVVLLLRRLGLTASSKASPVAAPSPAPISRRLETPKKESVPSPKKEDVPTGLQQSRRPDEEIVHFEEDHGLQKTLVVNANPLLRALSGPGAGKNFPLSASGRTTLGRSRRNDIVVPEDAASAQHCRIDREADSYVIYDLGATNGTWINGSKTERSVLQHGDRLKVGDTVFTVNLFGDRS